MFELIDRLVWKSQNHRALPELENLREKYNHPDNYYRFLYFLAQELKPAIALEIGIDEGVGSYHLAVAGGQVIGIDIRNDKLDSALNEKDNFTFLNMPASESSWALSELVDKHGPIGLVYQDSSHHYAESKTEWNVISPFCKPGAVWICDDITPAFHDPRIDPPGKGMMQYFEEIPRRYKRLYRNVLHEGNVQGVVIV